ncbi:MAG: uroporphyrinogen decarboxylase family protein [Candidatus Methanoplasma sp.]|jgi:uroporphyrinogen decarboxylase|nr:uroporphyrinogen decarboxylase family protein [Candidatus Methanoplasma sp.]
MPEAMTHMERGMAALSNEPVDRLLVSPLSMGVQRRLIGDGVTYRDWAHDPKMFARSFVEGYKAYDPDMAVGLMDLSVMAGDLGAHVRMDLENTPFVDEHIIHDPEDYEKLEVPDIRKGRSAVLLEGTKGFAEALKNDIICAGFIEGPLLALSQSAGAERLFMDMYTNPSAVHNALEVMTDYDAQMVEGFGKTGVAGLVWDYLWGNYSCLGDAEYNEFEVKYAKKLNKLTLDNGMAVCVHNCADMPHLKTQVKDYKTSIYSMAWYPLNPDSPSATKVIEDGYADNCIMAGNIDPQLFIRGSVEKITKVTSDLTKEVKAALCKRGLNSTFCISSGCEVPPDLTTKLENIGAVVDTVKKEGKLA